ASTSQGNNHQQCNKDAEKVIAQNYYLLEANQNLSIEVRDLTNSVTLSTGVYKFVNRVRGQEHLDKWMLEYGQWLALAEYQPTVLLHSLAQS
ncbi:hypothetical protein B566_EDAN005866, partial [Ephemera danica]